MIDAMQTIPVVKSVGLVDLPPLSNGGFRSTNIFTDETTDPSAGPWGYQKVHF
jgi:hypothetical protein